jgi:NADH-quinone oxidoreductase subunit J
MFHPSASFLNAHIPFDQIFFFVVSGIMLGAAGCVVALPNPVYSVLSLLICLSSLSVLFLFLGSPFLAILQMLVYAGAVLVLFLFVVMLLNLQEEASTTFKKTVFGPVGAILAITVFTLLFSIIRATDHLHQTTHAPHITQVKDIAVMLFTTYLLPFEMTSFLMLVAVIGAVTLVRKKGKP